MMLKTFIYRGEGVKSTGSGEMSVGTKANSCCSFLGRVGIESTNGAIDKKILRLEGSHI